VPVTYYNEAYESFDDIAVEIQPSLVGGSILKMQDKGLGDAAAAVDIYKDATCASDIFISSTRIKSCTFQDG
jgi:hypothetical protein